jgi:hypothetical protein
MGSICVSSKPLEVGMREKYKMFVGHAKPGLKRIESTGDEVTVLALRCGSHFLCTTGSITGENHEADMALEIVDYDPTTRRILSIGKGTAPGQTPLIWWGFRLYNRTNFALLILDQVGECVKKVDRIEGIWHLDNDGNKLAGMKELKGLNYPSKVILDIFTDCEKQGNPSDMTRNEIDFWDGRLILGETIESLFV